MNPFDDEYRDAMDRDYIAAVLDRRNLHSAPFLFHDLTINRLNQVDPELAGALAEPRRRSR